MRRWRHELVPSNWVVCTVSDVTSPVETVDLAHSQDREIAYIDISSIDNIANRICEPKRLRLSAAPSRARQIVKSGDVLFATVRPYLRNIAQVPESLDDQIASTGFSVLRAVNGVDPRYLFYKAISREFVAALTGEQYGVSYPAVKDDQVRSRPVELPPYNEQRRIVAKIEELFSELDKTLENLTTAREQLKAYRQAILKNAFEGKLTADWRVCNAEKAQNPNVIRTAVSDTRRQCWNEQVGCRRPAYSEPLEYDPHDVPDVPREWAIVSMDELCYHITSGSRAWSAYYGEGDSVFIMAQNVRPGKYSPTPRQPINPPIENTETQRTRVQIDDLLVTIVGANTGDVCRFPVDTDNHYVCQSVALMRLACPAYSRYLEYYFQAWCGGQRQFRRYIYGAGRPHLSFEQLRQTVVPLPGIFEASEIVARLDTLIAASNHLLSTTLSEITRSDVIRQSILKKAFSGQLIAQDLTDEPASVLLERIRQHEYGTIAKRRISTNCKKEAA